MPWTGLAELHQDFHLQIRQKRADGKWYIRCPEHHGRQGTGPYGTWDQAMTVANLHLSNYNHF